MSDIIDARLARLQPVIEPYIQTDVITTSDLFLLLADPEFQDRLGRLAEEAFSYVVRAIEYSLPLGYRVSAEPVLDGLVRLLVEEDENPGRHLEVRGQSAFVLDSRVGEPECRVSDDPEPACVCDQFNGRGAYAGNASVCIHLLFYAIMVATGGSHGPDIDVAVFGRVLQLMMSPIFRVAQLLSAYEPNDIASQVRLRLTERGGWDALRQLACFDIRATGYILELLAAFLKADDAEGAKKLASPLLRYLAETLIGTTVHLVKLPQAYGVYGDHSDGEPYTVRCYPQISCTCARFVGTGKFVGQRGVCSHSMLVSILLALGWGNYGPADRTMIDDLLRAIALDANAAGANWPPQTLP